MSALPDAAVPNPPRQRRSRESLERVLEAGVQLLGETDYDGFTLGELSRRAKVSVGSIYARFGSKDDLFLALQDVIQARVRDEQAAAFAALDHAHPGETIEAAVGALADVTRRHAAVLRVLMVRSAIDERTRDSGSRAAGGVAELFCAAILAHREAIVHPDPELATDIAFRMVFSTLARRVIFGPTFESKRRIGFDRFVAEQATLCRAYLLGQ
jgi:AcrR family transcriptional regulator